MVMMHPILRPDLRILKEGKQSPQEVDLVLFDGAHKPVIGEHKSHVKSRQPVDKLVKTAEKLRQRAEEGMGKYREFQNREIGLAFMAESVAPVLSSQWRELAETTALPCFAAVAWQLDLESLGCFLGAVSSDSLNDLVLIIMC